MNNKVLTIIGVIVILLLGFFIFRGGDTPEETMNEDTQPENEQTQEVLSGSGEYEVAVGESQFLWEGDRPLIPNYTDSGIVLIQEGSITVEEGAITSAEVVFDMTTIEAVDTSAEEASPSRLTTHLRSEDWFEVEVYPEARVEVTNVEQVSGTSYDVTADLTLRNTTESITFPAEIYMNTAGNLVVEADVEVDRTRFGINYGSGSFFDDLGERVIDNTFRTSIMLIAEPVEASEENTEESEE